MTSQVALFNLNGIAVASDTVATSQTDRGNKTTINAEKIYPLGDDHLVVALHYGGSAINDLQQQFHFNRWIESLTKPLDRLEDYLKSYVEWTKKNPLHSRESETIEIRATIEDHFRELVRRTQKDVEAETPENHWEFVFERLEFHARAGFEYLKGLPKIEGVTLEGAKELIVDHKVDYKEVFESAAGRSWVFESHPKLPANISRLLSQSGPYTLVGAQDLFWDSYLAFVGYGTKDHFGSTVTMQCRSILNDQLVYSVNEVSSVRPGTQQAKISTFAQADAIDSFIKGYNADIMGGVLFAIESLSMEALDGRVSEDELAIIAKTTYDYISDHSWRNYISPMLRQISGMNLFTLSELARTLVGLQATSSEAKDGPSTVGGLVEVLTIDRLNGVRWRSRLP